MRTIVVGAVASTVVALEALSDLGSAPSAVYTLSPDRSRRHSDYVDLRPRAEEWQIPVVEAADVNAPETLRSIREIEPDLTFVIGWSQICRPEFLNLAAEGSIGFHPSMLPLNRGRAVIPWTILQGLHVTGSTLFWMDEGVDSGDILAQATVPIEPDETARSLYDKHLAALDGMLRRVVPGLLQGERPRAAQDHSRATYCAKRTVADGLIDWSLPARTIWTLIRAAGRPYPGAFTYRRGRRLTVWEAEWVGVAPYHGLPGQVQRIDQAGALIQCGDREHLLLKEVELDEAGSAAPAQLLRVHERLGMSLVDLVERRGQE